jgi:predicted ATP-binding protein involved in virulence
VTPVSLREKVRLAAALQELVEGERVALVKDGKRRSIHVNPALLGRETV